MPNHSTPFNNHLVVFLGEFLGTFLFLFMSFAGAQVAHAGSSSLSTDPGSQVIQLFYISLVFGLSLMVNVWVFFRISGGLFNPAVSSTIRNGLKIPIARESNLLVVGHPRIGPHWSSSCHAVNCYLLRRNHRFHCSSRPCPRPFACYSRFLRQCSCRWRVHRPWFIPRDVPNCTAHRHDHYVSNRSQFLILDGHGRGY